LRKTLGESPQSRIVQCLAQSVQARPFAITIDRRFHLRQPVGSLGKVACFFLAEQRSPAQLQPLRHCVDHLTSRRF